MKCPYCNAENEENAIYCGECGKQIKNEPGQQAGEDDLWTESMTFSWKPDEKAGHQTPPNQAPPDPNGYQNVRPPVYMEPKKKSNTAIYVAIALCLVAVIGLAGVLGVKLLNKGDEDTAAISAEKQDKKEKDSGKESEDVEEKTTEEAPETTTEEIVEYLPGVDPSNTADFSNCLSTDSYIQMSGDDATMAFAYPRDFFGTSTEGENDYSFYSSDGSVTLHYWKEEVGSNGVSTLTNEFYNKKSELNTSGMDDGGTERFSGIAMDWSDKDIPHYVLGGRYISDLYKGYYSVASLQNGAIYHMEFEYPVDYNNGFANPTNYMIDCLYRYCEFSGSTKSPRSYSQFQSES